jgi:hypothetical protein
MKFSLRDLFVFVSVAALVCANIGLTVHCRRVCAECEDFRSGMRVDLILDNVRLRERNGELLESLSITELMLSASMNHIRRLEEQRQE